MVAGWSSCRPGEARRDGLEWGKPGDAGEELADPVRLLDWVAQGLLGNDLIVVAATVLGPPHIATRDEVGDDRLRGALGDPDPVGDVPASDPRVAGNADEDVAVIGQERPARAGRIRGRAGRIRHRANGSCPGTVPVTFPPRPAPPRPAPPDGPVTACCQV